MFAAFRRKLTIPVEHRAEVGIFILIGVGWIAGLFAGAAWKPLPPRVIHTPVSLAAAVAALGQPDQAVDGAQIGLNGTTCFYWQSKNILICKP